MNPKNTLIQGHIGMQHTARTNHTVIPDMDPCKESDLFLDDSLIPHKDEGMNGDILGNLSTFTDLCQRRDTCCLKVPPVQKSQEASKSELRLVDLKQSLLGGQNTRQNDHCRGTGLLQPLLELFLHPPG